jgi:hypothetical protein
MVAALTKEAGIPDWGGRLYQRINAALASLSTQSASGVTAGNYTDPNLTIDATGRVTAASNGIGEQTALFTNTQPNGTPSGESFVASTWTTRALNTADTNDISGLALVGSQLVFSPPAVPGTYETVIMQNINGQNTVKGRLRDMTGNVTIVDGIAYNSGNCSAQGQFALAGNTTVAVQIFATTSGNLTGGGAFSSGDPEVYASIYLRKIA